MSERPFRSPESYDAEDVTRDMLPDFLRDRGFVVESDNREHQGQTIVAKSPEGEPLTMRVRLCWRRETGSRNSERTRSYSAAQLLAKIKDDDWIGSLQAKVDREKSREVTHLLFVQRDDKVITYAPLVPLFELIPIWTEQRDISDRLRAQGKLGRRKKNHAMNGTSPTLWLQDDRGGKEVADALWTHRGVRDIAGLPRKAEAGQSFLLEDGVAVPLDLTNATSDPEELERRVSRLMTIPLERPSGDPRPRKVVAGPRITYERRADVKAWVLREACGRCERCLCAAPFKRTDGTPYLELHHARQLAEGGPDTVDNAVALCANCHRLLHYGLDRAQQLEQLYGQVARLLRYEPQEHGGD